ncbi:MAG TPA: NAD-dependent epimerase/dehydratase family protein [Thermomicrobiales bacterium]|nr:NAD-dependent epimerase/dehydratase family protein [Thermomicrobiales bacterium]
MANVLVLGGTSFIGPSVVRSLVEAGHRVAVFNRGKSEANLPEGVERIIGERARIEEARDAFRAFAPDVAIDMYAMTEEDARLANAGLRGIAGRVVAISSLDVYRAYDRFRRAHPGAPDPVPLTEDAPLREHLYPYREQAPGNLDRPWFRDYDKILVERVVLGDPELPGTVVRLPMVYGERDRQHRYWPYLKRMDDERPWIVLSEGMASWRSHWGYVDNIADAIALAATDERAAGRIYNLGEPENPTTAEIIAEIAELTGWQGELITVPDDQLDPGFDTAQHLVADTTRFREELGYAERVPRPEALSRTIAWERANPPEDPLAGIDYEREDALVGNR